MAVVVLAYDLQGAERGVQEKLEGELVSRRYERLFGPTTWAKSYADDADVEDLLRTTETDFRNSASAVGATTYSLKIFIDEKEIKRHLSSPPSPDRP